jgi:MFS family permease
MTAVFAWVESRAADPIIPLRLFKEPIFTLSNIVMMLSSGVMFGGILYIPIFIQMVLGQSATNSGLVLLPLMIGVVAGSITSGQIVARTGKYRVVGLIGFAITVVALYLLSQLTRDTSSTAVIRDMVLLGLGLGPSLPLLPIIVQNVFGPRDVGVVTGAVTFFRTIGGAVGTAILGTIFTTHLNDSLKIIPVTGALSSPQAQPAVDALRNPNVVTSQTALHEVTSHIPAAVLPLLQPGIDAYVNLSKTAIADAIAVVFTAAMGLGAVALVLFYLVEERELRSSNDPAQSGEPTGI